MKLWTPQVKIWVPHLGAQTEFLQRTEFEVLFGGVRGGGMTDCILSLPARNVGESGNEK